MNTVDLVEKKELDSLNLSFDDAYHFDTATGKYVAVVPSENIVSTENDAQNMFSDIPENKDVVSLTTTGELRLLNIQAIARAGIRVSLKSFLISITLTFLNLFT